MPDSLTRWVAPLATAAVLASTPAALAQTRPYIGYAYPAGGQRGTTFQIKLGGQGLEGANKVFITGPGITARLVEYDRVLGAQEITLLNEQLKELKRAKTNTASVMTTTGAPATTSEAATMTSSANTDAAAAKPWDQDEAARQLAARIQKRVAETVNRPASAALANIAYAEITIAPDAPVGGRELRLGTLRGISNPLVFEVGQFPEVTRKAMVTAPLQVLGKEEQALRKRPADEVEERITLPCVVNGQIASGEFNRYRFSAKKGQRLVFTTEARQLIPYIADAVPGWFQPVLALYDADGKEVAYDDDYRFKPDPTILCEVPKDGEYTFVIYDAIYRGREDFVYRITAGEIPFVTSVFPLGARVGTPVTVKARGWNFRPGAVAPPPTNAAPGVYQLVATQDGLVSNPTPFELGTLPETFEQEPNNTAGRAQKVTLPIIINGRVDRPDDWDMFRFTGKSNQTVVAEVYARRLDSPLDSIVKLSDAAGKILAFNDDHEDLGSGVNTHHADSWLMTRLPADGTYFVLVGDTARAGGPEYGYRLRLSAPQPDFALRVVPSSASLRSKSTTQLNVHVIRKDGFTGPIKLSLKDPPPGFSAVPVSLTGTQAVARLTLKTDLVATEEPVTLSVVGTAHIKDSDVVREAVPAEDRMQAFYWRHLVPANELKVLVFDQNYQPPPKRVPRTTPPAVAEAKPAAAPVAQPVANKPNFSKQQVAGRLRQLKLLFEEGLLTDDFYELKVAECEAAR